MGEEKYAALHHIIHKFTSISVLAGEEKLADRRVFEIQQIHEQIPKEDMLSLLMACFSPS